MIAFQFDAFVEDGLITVPKEVKKELGDGIFKVILLKEGKKNSINEFKKNIKLLFEQFPDTTPFKEIEDPVAWQKQIRSEWD